MKLKGTMTSHPKPTEAIEAAIAAIEAAFADVRLGSGVSIRQADAMDNYDGEEEQALARELDEHEDWKRIPEEVILHAPSAMSFMDAQGILFQLPASMCFALRHYHNVANCSVDSAMIRLTDASFIKRYKHRLTEAQIAAIVLFLQAYGELEPGLLPDLELAAELWQA